MPVLTRPGKDRRRAAPEKAHKRTLEDVRTELVMCRERIEEEYGLELELLMEARRLARGKPEVAGLCQICGCSEEASCPGGCAWAVAPHFRGRSGLLCDRCGP